MKFKKLSALILSILLALQLFPVFSAASTQQKQNGLVNSWYKMQQNESDFKVAFVGGSITVGSGASNWKNRYATVAYNKLKTEIMPKTKTGEEVKYNAAERGIGIGGTGTEFAAYRIHRDLQLDTAPPDLTFVEFAINDHYDQLTYEESAMYMEAIVRKLYAANPKMDIVILLTTDFERYDTDFDNFRAHKDVAEYYGIPYVEMGKALVAKLHAENGGEKPVSPEDAAWSKYFTDIVHPTDAGHAIYADCIAEKLKEEFKNAEDENPASAANMVLSPAKYDSEYLKDAYMVSFDGYVPSNDNQWTTSIVQTTDNDNQIRDTYITATKPNQPFSFSFKGTGLLIRALSIAKSKGYGDLDFYIDGVKYSKPLTSQYDMVTLAENLPYATHEVTLLTGENTIPAGKSLTLRGIGITGDPEKGGISIHNEDITSTYLRPDKTLSVNFNTGTVITNNVHISRGSDEIAQDGTGSYFKEGQTYTQPIFYQFDLSEYNPDDIKQAVFFGNWAQSNLSKNVLLFDVPGDDLSYTAGSTERIEINRKAILQADAYQPSLFGAEAAALDANILFFGDKKEADSTMTAYIKEQAATENKLATFMFYSRHSSTAVFKEPVLMIKAANDSATLSIALTADKTTVEEGEGVTLRASVVSSYPLVGVDIYVDGVKSAIDAVSADGKNYTAVLEGLAYGRHMIKAVATDIMGETVTSDEISVFSSSSKILFTPDLLINIKNASELLDVNSQLSVGGNHDNDPSHNNVPSGEYPWFSVFANGKLPELADDMEIKRAVMLAMSPDAVNTTKNYSLYNISDDISTYTKDSVKKLEDYGSPAFSGKFTANASDYTKATGFTDDYNLVLDVTEYIKELYASQADSYNFMWWTNAGYTRFCYENYRVDKMVQPITFYMEIGKPLSASFVSNNCARPGLPFKARVKVEGATEPNVTIALDNEVKGAMTKDADGLYEYDFDGMSKGTYKLTVQVTDALGYTASTEQTFIVYDDYHSIIAPDLTYEYYTNEVTKREDWQKDPGVWKKSPGDFYKPIVNNIDGQLTVTGSAYARLDLTKIANAGNIDKIYITYALRELDGKSVNNTFDFVRCEDFTVEDITTGANATINLNDEAAPFASVTNADSITSESEHWTKIRDTITISSNATVNGGQQMADVTDYIKGLLEDGEDTLCMHYYKRATNEDRCFFGSYAYLYVTYKDEIAKADGENIKVTLKPSLYSEDGKVLCIIANYDMDENLINVATNTLNNATGWEEISKPNNNAHTTKVFVWKNAETFMPLRTNSVLKWK